LSPGGRNEEWFIALQEETGREIKALKKRVILRPESYPYIEAYNSLARKRPVYHGGPGAIPNTEIESYLRIKRINNPEEIEEFHYFIDLIDSEFLAHQPETQAQPTEKEK
jgi:hypothetical protein